jgi:cytochrome c553
MTLTARHSAHQAIAGCALFFLLATSAAAQDARRGAALYMQLPGGGASCVSCHGPEPQGNRNSLLKAADNPQALTKALSTVGVMSFLRASLDEAAVADLAAFLGSVNRASAQQSALTLWPLTADFGNLGLGTTGGPQRVMIANRGSTALRLDAPRLQGGGVELRHDCAAVLQPGALCSASLTAWATATGPFTGALEVNSPDQPGALVVAWAGVVKPAAAGVLQWDADAALSADTALSANTALSLGAVPAGQTQRRTLNLVNAGTEPVRLGAAPAVAGSLTLTGNNLVPLSVSGCAAGTLLAPSARCAVTVELTGGSRTEVRAVLQVRSDGQNPPALRIEADAVPVITTPVALVVGVSPESPSNDTSGGGAFGPLWSLGLLAAVWVLRRRVPGALPEETAGAGKP